MGTERELIAESLAGMEANGVPPHIADALRAYALDGVKPGSFTCACIDNDFVGALCHAGMDVTAEQMRAVAKTLYNDLPSPAWGSAAKRLAWSAARGCG